MIKPQPEKYLTSRNLVSLLNCDFFRSRRFRYTRLIRYRIDGTLTGRIEARRLGEGQDAPRPGDRETPARRKGLHRPPPALGRISRPSARAAGRAAADARPCRRAGNRGSRSPTRAKPLCAADRRGSLRGSTARSASTDRRSGRCHTLASAAASVSASASALQLGSDTPRIHYGRPGVFRNTTVEPQSAALTHPNLYTTKEVLRNRN